MKQRAFTLMELMIVIVIIGILSGVGMVVYGKITVAAKKAATISQFYTFVDFVTLKLTECYTGKSHIKLMWKSENTTLYPVTCAQFSNGTGMNTGGTVNKMINHIKNSAGGGKGGKSGKGFGWVNPYAEGGYYRIDGKDVKRKNAWGPGNAFSGTKGAILTQVKYDYQTGLPYNIIVISTQYDDSNEPNICNKNCVTLTKEIPDQR